MCYVCVGCCAVRGVEWRIDCSVVCGMSWMCCACACDFWRGLLCLRVVCSVVGSVIPALGVACSLECCACRLFVVLSVTEFFARRTNGHRQV